MIDQREFLISCNTTYQKKSSATCISASLTNAPLCWAFLPLSPHRSICLSKGVHSPRCHKAEHLGHEYFIVSLTWGTTLFFGTQTNADFSRVKRMGFLAFSPCLIVPRLRDSEGYQWNLLINGIQLSFTVGQSSSVD